jgi:hypothetical protein
MDSVAGVVGLTLTIKFSNAGPELESFAMVGAISSYSVTFAPVQLKPWATIS